MRQEELAELCAFELHLVLVVLTHSFRVVDHVILRGQELLKAHDVWTVGAPAVVMIRAAPVVKQRNQLFNRTMSSQSTGHGIGGC